MGVWAGSTLGGGAARETDVIGVIAFIVGISAGNFFFFERSVLVATTAA